VRGSQGCCHDDVVVVRLLIVDDHDGFRAVARLMFEAAGFEVVGEADDAESAVRSAALLRPAVVLLDVALPDGDGFDVCEELTAGEDPPAVVLTSSRDASEYADRLAVTSARGFLPKSRLSGPALAGLMG
jgi:DNA-binding NarL/FixJ family response regulator